MGLTAKEKAMSIFCEFNVFLIISHIFVFVNINI